VSQQKGLQKGLSDPRAKRTSLPGRGPGGHAAGRPVEKAKDFKGTLKRLLSYFKPHRLKFSFVFLAAIISTTFNIASPRIMGMITTTLFEGVMGKVQGSGTGIDFERILTIVFILIGIYGMSSLFGFFQQFIMADVAQKTVYDMRKQVDNKLKKLPLKYYDETSHGDILSRVTNDVDTIGNTLQQSLTQFITSLVTVIGVVVMMFLMNYLLALVTMLTLPLSLILIKGVTKRSQKQFFKQAQELGQLNGHVEEMFTGHTIIKAYSHEEKSIREFEEINDRLYHAGWRAQFLSGIMMPLMNFVGNIGYIIICVTGVMLAVKGSITVGNIQAFIQYSRQFTQPMVQLANIANIIQSTIAGSERVFQILDEEEQIPDLENALELGEPGGEVLFDHVKFGYKKDVTVIKDLSLDVKKGDLIAIVGPTGAGKTTLVNLMMRFYETDSGEIRIDGKNINNLRRSDLRRAFGMVLQDTWMFKGSIFENIAYGNPSVPREKVIEAAKTAHADHFIRSLPHGYDTVLNEEASNISQGQKQLLTIARAILANPAILILDEATSSVDTRTEKYIQNGMTALMEGRTSFVIAHRLSTIKDASTILVMDGGDIIEKGNHQSLMAQDGFYADLYNSQFTSGRAI
jgi:ATP-binding cassette subfamily B multidrug efflux pump